MSTPPKNTKEHKFCFVHGLETKQSQTGDLIKEGFIATTHLDSGFMDEERGVYVRDRITPETLSTWANLINEGDPRANKVSINHNRETHVAGVGVKDTAKVVKLPDGEYGLYVASLIDKTKDDFEETAYRLEKGLLDSYSIEFRTRDPATGDYLPGAVVEQESDKGVVRTLLPGTQLEGWTLASRPMNSNCVMLKEIMPPKEGSSDKDDESEEEKKKKKKKSEAEAGKDSEKQEEKKPNDSKEVKTMEPETKEIPVAPAVKETKEVDKDYEEFKEFKKKEKKELEMTALKKEIKEDLVKEISKIEIKEKKMINSDAEVSEITEFKEMIGGKKKCDIGMQFKMAARIAEQKGMITSVGVKEGGRSEHKSFSTNGSKLEYKSLGLTTNQNTDTDYLLSAAELADVFDPVIYNVLNQQTVLWNVLAKDDFSNKGNNQVQFTLKIAANTTAAAYTGNALSTGNVTRLKYMTKFKKYAVGVEVDGDMIAAARGGPIGDVFAQEVQDSTVDLMSVMNQALYAEVGTETAAGVIGLAYLSDSAGNTSLYNLTRSTANKLGPTAAADTYINGSSASLSLALLRQAKRQALKEGAQLTNLMFVGDYTQGDKLRGIYDAAQRPVPTSSRFGFEGRPEFDGIPFFEDKDCKSGSVFLVDLETHRVAIWVPPTLEMLGKDADSQKGFIKTYWATYNRAPRRVCEIYSLSTS